jgi:glutathione S-transferase
MLKLYSFGPGANSLKPLLTLYERGIPFESRFLSAATFDQHSGWFKKINPNGQVPALDHDGKVITESTVICEYLEDVFIEAQYPSMRPSDPYLRAQMRIWTKWVDEYFCWCVSTIGWHRRIGPLARSLSDADFEEHVKAIPIYEQQVKWRRAREGFPQEMLDEEMRKIEFSVNRLEARLAESEWLAGPDYSLADICNFAIANTMEVNYAELVNEADAPHLLAWIKRIQARPACQKMFANAPGRTPSHAEVIADETKAKVTL